MSETAPSPKPRKSRRMVVWMVAVPVVILLLALAGANWKFFHLAYAKHLMRSDDPEKHYRGMEMVIDTHLREGMRLEEVRELLEPARLTEPGNPPGKARAFKVSVVGDPPRFDRALAFDKDDRLRLILFN